MFFCQSMVLIEEMGKWLISKAIFSDRVSQTNLFSVGVCVNYIKSICLA